MGWKSPDHDKRPIIDSFRVLLRHDFALMLTMEDFERECKDIFEAVGEAFGKVIEAGGGCLPSEVIYVYVMYVYMYVRTYVYVRPYMYVCIWKMFLTKYPLHEGLGCRV